MTIESDIFRKKIPNVQKLLEYGFHKDGQRYFYEQEIMRGQFNAIIDVQADHLTGKLFDTETGEEYVLIHAENQSGNFIGEVRANYQKLLKDIAKNCFTAQYFLTPQANQIQRLVQKELAEKPDFPFKRFPDYGVFRNHLNKKWFGLIMNISLDKLTHKAKDAKKEIEILDLKINPQKHEELLNQTGFYPSYHMHKESWITILLNETVKNSVIMELLEESYQLTGGNNKQLTSSSWLIPANPKYYDIAANFKVGQKTIWKQSTKILRGDTVYLYVSSPVKAVKYKCQVVKTDIPYQYADGNIQMKKIMEVEVLKEYPAELCPFSRLQDFGIKAVRGPRRMPVKLVEFLNK